MFCLFKRNIADIKLKKYEKNGKNWKLEIKCPNNCNDHGICMYGQCYCDPHYDGDGCNRLVKHSRSCKINF